MRVTWEELGIDFYIDPAVILQPRSFEPVEWYDNFYPKLRPNNIVSVDYWYGDTIHSMDNFNDNLKYVYYQLDRPCFGTMISYIDTFRKKHDKLPKYLAYNIDITNGLPYEVNLKYLNYMKNGELLEYHNDSLEQILRSKQLIIKDFGDWIPPKLYMNLCHFRTMRQQQQYVEWVNWCCDNYHMHPATALAAGCLHANCNSSDHYLCRDLVNNYTKGYYDKVYYTENQAICVVAYKIWGIMNTEFDYSPYKEYLTGTYNCYNTINSIKLPHKIDTEDIFSFNPKEVK